MVDEVGSDEYADNVRGNFRTHISNAQGHEEAMSKNERERTGDGD